MLNDLKLSKTDSQTNESDQQNPIIDQLISIHLLECVIETINYTAITFLFQTRLELCKYIFPILLNWTDNSSAKSWIKKAAAKTTKGKAL